MLVARGCWSKWCGCWRECLCRLLALACALACSTSWWSLLVVGACLSKQALLEAWLRPLLRGLVVVVGCRWLLEGMAVVVVGERLLELQPVGPKLLVQAVR